MRARFVGIDVPPQAHFVAIIDQEGQLVLSPVAFEEDDADQERFGLLASPMDRWR